MGWIQEVWSYRKNPFSIRELRGSDELQKLFVDREKEIKLVRNTLTGSGGGVVYGISGTRGSGKSTVLNKVLSDVRAENGLIVKVKASGIFTELDFLRKLLTDICDQIEMERLPEEVTMEINRLKTNLLYNEKIAEGKANEASIRASIKASFLSFLSSEIGSEVKEKMERKIEKQLKQYSKSTLTREIEQFLSYLRKQTKYDYMVIGIDETDKCRFEVAEELLESVKTVLGTEHCHFVFVGTKEFYDNFSRAFRGQEEEATLASIFNDIILIRNFADEQILKIIDKRLVYYSLERKPKNPFSEKATQVILDLANGNPKQAMRLCSESFMYFGDEGEIINSSGLVSYFDDRGYIPDLSPAEQEYVDVVRRLGRVTATSKELIKELGKKRIEHDDEKQYRVNLERLVRKKYLKKITPKKGQVTYVSSEILKHIS